jgi:hypothetical protein
MGVLGKFRQEDYRRGGLVLFLGSCIIPRDTRGPGDGHIRITVATAEHERCRAPSNIGPCPSQN